MTRRPSTRLSLNALTCFEAASRHANFTRAARELNVTQAAVSKQIKLLEAELNAPLFVRGNRAVALTGAGKRLFEGVAAGMKAIDNAIDDISRSSESTELVITTTVAMASLWLMPRLASFRAEHPQIAIKLIASDALLDFNQDRVDVAIRYGHGDWPHLDNTFLFGVHFQPVCSPAFLNAFPMRTIDDIRNARLLYLDGPAARYQEWEWWFASNGVDVDKLDAELSFNNYPLLVQAAVAGQGVLLAWGNVIDDVIKSGSLVPIVEVLTPSNYSYYLVTNRRRTVRPEARVFKNWLMHQTRELRSTSL